MEEDEERLGLSRDGDEGRWRSVMDYSGRYWAAYGPCKGNIAVVSSGIRIVYGRQTVGGGVVREL